MKIFTNVLFPLFYDRLMGSPAMDEARRLYLAQAHGRVLEIGFGTGQNLPHYPPDVRELTVADPNPGMQRAARKRLAASHVRVDFRRAAGESLPFADDCFDCVVSAYTLCSIEHVEAAIGEIRRVLKPGGRFLFLEHGLAHEHDPAVRKWQHRLNPLQKKFAAGCRLNRNIRELVVRGFEHVEMQEYYMRGDPRTHGYTYQGAAIKH